jgi:hypothetical protein
MSGSHKKRHDKARQRRRRSAKRHRWDALNKAVSEQMAQPVDRKRIDALVKAKS